ncbi:MAG: hypothetical protein GWN30_29310 [Gammaproteobacteria bacterium]|nr:hypothetical protein [Gammaproteobacteria bacterium]
MVTVFLRSFIAPGFMLSVSPDKGLGIIFCDGPVAVYSQEDTSPHHHHDGGHEASDSVTHISPICSHWLTSGANAIMVSFEAFQFDTQFQDEVISQDILLTGYSVFTNRTIRAPPILS